MKYYKVSEVAEKLGVERTLVYYWRDKGWVKLTEKYGLFLISDSQLKKLRKLIRK